MHFCTSWMRVWIQVRHILSPLATCSCLLYRTQSMQWGPVYMWSLALWCGVRSHSRAEWTRSCWKCRVAAAGWGSSCRWSGSRSRTRSSASGSCCCKTDQEGCIFRWGPPHKGSLGVKWWLEGFRRGKGKDSLWR